MRLNSKGQVTIPAEIRHRHRLQSGDEVEVVEVDGTLRIQRIAEARTRGERFVSSIRGRADTELDTDELMSLLRDD